jgi:hypothetical protein
LCSFIAAKIGSMSAAVALRAFAFTVMFRSSYAAAAFGGSIRPTICKACCGVAPPPHTA